VLGNLILSFQAKKGICRIDREGSIEKLAALMYSKLLIRNEGVDNVPVRPDVEHPGYERK
jgi:hypothetical protein